MSLLHDAYTALLSGLTTKTGNEIHWQDKKGNPITIEPIDVSKNKYIIRRYYSNGKKWWEDNYQNGQLHGKSIGWHENGNKWREEEWLNGQLHGKYTEWHYDGNKYRQDDYQNGQLHGKSIGWYKSGNKIWEVEYQNGKLIK